MGERREEMVKDMGGEGLEEGDFAGLGHFITKGKVELLEEGRRSDRLSSAHTSAFMGLAWKGSAVRLSREKCLSLTTGVQQPYLASS